MAEVILVIVVLLWVLGYLSIPGLVVPNVVLFALNGHPVTLVNFLIFLLVLWITRLIKSPASEISTILLVLWVLSVFGFISIPGLTNIIFIILVLGIASSFFGKK